LTLKKALKWSALLLGLLAVVLTAVSLVFYLRWMRPDVPLPGTRMTQRSVGAASAGFEEEIAFARGRLAASVEQLDLPSISIAVGTADGPIWSEAVGLADLDSGTAAGVTTAYIVGSTAKAITSVLLARLLDRRAIDLDAPLSGYLSGLPAHLGEVTARQLASHTAGVRHYGFDLLSYPPHDSFSRRHYANVTEALAAISGDPLEFPPGSDFKYSTFGYILLSAALEAAAGSSYPDLLRDEIARPLGLSTLAVEIAGRFLQGMRRRPPVPSGAGTSQLPKNRVALEQPPVAGVLQKGLNVRDDGGPVESGQALDQNLPPRPGSDRRSFPPRLRQGVGEQFEIG